MSGLKNIETYQRIHDYNRVTGVETRVSDKRHIQFKTKCVPNIMEKMVLKLGMQSGGIMAQIYNICLKYLGLHRHLI